jgi:hypothetical protein
MQLHSGRKHISWQTSQVQLTSQQCSSSSRLQQQLLLLLLLRRQVVMQLQMVAHLMCMVPLAALVAWQQHWLLLLLRSHLVRGQEQALVAGAVATCRQATQAKRLELWHTLLQQLTLVATRR